MTTWIIILLSLWPLFWVVRVLFVTRLLMGLEFCRTSVKVLAAADIPPHIQEATKPWVTQLEGLGFRCLGGWKLHSTTNVAFDDYAVVLERANQPIRAIIQPYEESARSGECWASLRTTKADGTEIVTASQAPEELLALAPGMEVEVLHAASPEELLQRHLARVLTAGPDCWLCPDLPSAAVREEHVRDATLGYAYGVKALSATDAGVYSYRVSAALRRAVALIRRAAHLKKNQRKGQRSVISTLSPESQLEFDLHQYRQQGALRRGRFSLKAKTAITCLSFLGFAGVLAWQYSFVVAVTLIVALIIHECGHLLGMRWFGYRDTQLLFVPFFGGAAVGHDEKVLSPWKHIVIILLGPMPGIFLGLVLLVYASGGSAPAWINQVAITLLALNVFNLLPILPLDGGQVVDFAVASRFPRVRVFFLAISAVVMVLLGQGINGAKILFGLGIATLIRLPVEWRLAGLRRMVREQFPDGGEEEPIVRSLALEMREPEWKKTSVAQRLQLIRGLQQVLRMPRPGVGTMCFALAGFTAPLWFGTPLALWAVVRQGEARVHEAYARAEAAGLTVLPPRAASAEVKPEDNAAVPYEQAAALVREDAEEGEASDTPQKEQIVSLLRTAAQKSVFVPSVPVGPAKSHRKWAGWGNGGLVGHLTTAATERLRYQEGAEAAALAIDALKLLRLMQSAPGYLNWHEYQFLAQSGWTVIEESLASGVKLAPDKLAELRLLCTEQPDITFAAAALPRALLAQSGMEVSDELPAVEGENTGRFLRLMQRVNPVWTRLQVESIDQAILARNFMDGIVHGEWPKAAGAADLRSQAMLNVAKFGDAIARQRQAKVALLLLEQSRQSGTRATLLSLGASQTELSHPYTREPMTLVHRGSLDVLGFASGSVQAPASEDYVDRAALVWRVPVAQR